MNQNKGRHASVSLYTADGLYSLQFAGFFFLKKKGGWEECIFISNWHKYNSVIMNFATISMDQIISVLILLNSWGVRAGSDPACYMCLCYSNQVRVNRVFLELTYVKGF